MLIVKMLISNGRLRLKSQEWTTWHEEARVDTNNARVSDR